MQDVDRALELANEMSTRNIERNVHTYTVSHCPCKQRPSFSMSREVGPPGMVMSSMRKVFWG